MPPDVCRSKNIRVDRGREQSEVSGLTLLGFPPFCLTHGLRRNHIRCKSQKLQKLDLIIGDVNFPPAMLV